MIQKVLSVQDVPVARMTNSVLVGTMKFTLDQFEQFFTIQNPAPARLAAQFAEFTASYKALNEAYALTRESLVTVDIQGLDTEGDQLFIGLKETIEGARRMTVVPTRKQAGDRLQVFIKKYQVDVKENMVSEWSKLQQMTEEGNNSTQITQDLATLGLTELWARLTEIAAELRAKLTERSAELPAQQSMKLARETVAAEYRMLIDVLNAYALIDNDLHRFDSLISTINNNIYYVRVHAMAKSGNVAAPDVNPQPSGNDTPAGGGNSGGGSTPTPTPTPTPGDDDGGDVISI
jgi:hypothetical protein